jgi:zinc D-Ala-D-Ala dipeptidase
VVRRLAVAACVAALALGGCSSYSPLGGPASRQVNLGPPRSPAHAAPRFTTTANSVPPVSDAARAAHLRDIRSIVPDAIVDLRYATPQNFVGVRLYPRDARCLVHRSMAPGLRVAAQRLRRHGFVLVFWDCYRPHHVQVRMYEDTPNPAWVARPGPYATSHEAARSVDVTLAKRTENARCPRMLTVHGHCRLRMGTNFDNFTPRAYAYATYRVTPRAQHNRAVLRRAMAAGGFSVYSGEWWHFDGPGALVHRPILRVPVD